MFNKIYENVKEFILSNFSFIIFLIIIIVCTFVKLPYQVEMPGGTIDLSNRVKVNGEKVEVDGTFNMAYVSVVQGSIPYLLLGAILPDWDVVKSSDVTYEGETIEEANKRDRLYLEQSKDYAIVTAMDAAGLDYEITDRINYVAYISTEADTTLKIGDDIISCDGTEVMDIQSVKSIINSKNAGDEISFVVLRDGKEKEATAKIYEEDDSLYVGISSITTVDIKSDIDVEINTKLSESGPSGGMMMALMTYNALTKQDLTHGKNIVGTGTINLDGTVGEIGGVKYKLMGAVRKNADVLLVPEGNYEEAMKVKKDKGYDIDIVSVKTLSDAINYLEGL